MSKGIYPVQDRQSVSVAEQVTLNHVWQHIPKLMSCQLRVTVTSFFVYKVIRDL